MPPRACAHNSRLARVGGAFEGRGQNRRNLWSRLPSRSMQLSLHGSPGHPWHLGIAQAWPAVRKEPNIHGGATHSPKCQLPQVLMGKRLPINKFNSHICQPSFLVSLPCSRHPVLPILQPQPCHYMCDLGKTSQFPSSPPQLKKGGVSHQTTSNPFNR